MKQSKLDIAKIILIICILFSVGTVIGVLALIDHNLKINQCNIPEGCPPYLIQRAVTITTDKSEYEQGEKVEINIKNNTKDEVFLTFPVVEVFEPTDKNLGRGEWETITPVEVWCGATGGLLYLPLAGGESYVYSSWDQKKKWCTGKLGGTDMNFQEVRPGEYRTKSVIVQRTKSAQEDPNNISGQPSNNFVYSNKFTIKGNDNNLVELDKSAQTLAEAEKIANDYFMTTPHAISVNISYAAESSEFGNYFIVNILSRDSSTHPTGKIVATYRIEKTAIDPRCEQKTAPNGDSVLCKGFQTSYEFDVNTGKCIGKETPACGYKIPFNSLEECQKICENVGVNSKYQVYSTGMGTSDKEKIIDSAYIYKNDKLPKVIKFGENTISIQKIEFTKTGGFMAYATVSYNNKEEKIGFWHPDGIIKNKTNGCINENGRNECGGILGITTKQDWSAEATEEEKANGIFSATYIERIFLQEIDYDINSNNWNYIKIVFGSYREPNYPIKAEISE